MPEYTRLMAADEVQTETSRPAAVAGRAILIANADGELFAVSDACTHAGAPRNEGFIEGSQIQCPFHGASFCLKTGRTLTPPACEGLASRLIRVIDGRIEVAV